MEPNNFLYKYTTYKAALKIFSSLTMKWSCAIEFNDPFDSRAGTFNIDKKALGIQMDEIIYEILFNNAGYEPFIGTSMYNIIQLLLKIPPAQRKEIYRDMKIKDIGGDAWKFAERKFEQDWEIARKRLFAMLCLTENENHPLMWSHYADSHSGVVIKFKRVNEGDTLVYEAEKVEYNDDLVSFAFNHEDFLNHIFGKTKLNAKSIFERCLLRKGKVWEYENEWRCKKPKTSQEYETFEFVSFRPYEVDSVFLGCRMDEENEKSILDILSKKLKHVSVYKYVLDDRAFKNTLIRVV